MTRVSFYGASDTTHLQDEGTHVEPKETNNSSRRTHKFEKTPRLHRKTWKYTRASKRVHYKPALKTTCLYRPRYRSPRVYFPCYWTCIYRPSMYKDHILLVPNVIFIYKFHCTWQRKLDQGGSGNKNTQTGDEQGQWIRPRSSHIWQRTSHSIFS